MTVTKKSKSAPVPPPVADKRRSRKSSGVSRVTAMERLQFKNGFISVRIAAFKINMHRSTFTRMCREGIEHICVHNSYYIKLDALRERVGKDTLEAVGATDWSNVLDEFDAE